MSALTVTVFLPSGLGSLAPLALGLVGRRGVGGGGVAGGSPSGSAGLGGGLPVQRSEGSPPLSSDWGLIRESCVTVRFRRRLHRSILHKSEVRSLDCSAA